MKQVVVNTRGMVIDYRESKTVIGFINKKKLAKRSMACVKMMTYNDGSLYWFNERIYLTTGVNAFTVDEDDWAQIISCESIHLALYRLGFGIENTLLDKMGLHSFTSFGRKLHYEGLNVDLYGETDLGSEIFG